MHSRIYLGYCRSVDGMLSQLGLRGRHRARRCVAWAVWAIIWTVKWGAWAGLMWPCENCGRREEKMRRVGLSWRPVPNGGGQRPETGRRRPREGAASEQGDEQLGLTPPPPTPLECSAAARRYHYPFTFSPPISSRVPCSAAGLAHPGSPRSAGLRHHW